MIIGSAKRPRPPARARLFLALWPGARERASLLAYQKQCAWTRGSSPVEADRLHLTLHFIGAVERERGAEIAAGLQLPVAAPGMVDAFELSLTRAEIWPRGLVVLRAPQPPDALQHLHAELGQALRMLKLPVDARPLRPHVTLARRAAASLLPSEPPSLRWPIDSYVLVESTLGAGGGYRLLRRYGCPGQPLAAISSTPDEPNPGQPPPVSRAS